MILLFYKKYEAQFQKDLNWEIKLWPLIFLACCPLENKWSSSIQNSHFHLLLSSKQHPFDLKFRPWIEFDFHIYHTRRFFLSWWCFSQQGWVRLDVLFLCLDFESGGNPVCRGQIAYWWARTEIAGFFTQWDQNGTDPINKAFWGGSSAQICICIDGILVSQDGDHMLKVR